MHILVQKDNIMLTECSFLLPLCSKCQSSASNVCIQPCSAHCASKELGAGAIHNNVAKKDITLPFRGRKKKEEEEKRRQDKGMFACLGWLVDWFGVKESLSFLKLVKSLTSLLAYNSKLAS